MCWFSWECEFILIWLREDPLLAISKMNSTNVNRVVRFWNYASTRSGIVPSVIRDGAYEDVLTPEATHNHRDDEA